MFRKAGKPLCGARQAWQVRADPELSAGLNPVLLLTCSVVYTVLHSPAWDNTEYVCHIHGMA